MFNIDREYQLAVERRADFLQEAYKATLIKTARERKPGLSARLLLKSGNLLIALGGKLKEQVELARPVEPLQTKRV